MQQDAIISLKETRGTKKSAKIETMFCITNFIYNTIR